MINYIFTQSQNKLSNYIVIFYNLLCNNYKDKYKYKIAIKEYSVQHKVISYKKNNFNWQIIFYLLLYKILYVYNTI